MVICSGWHTGSRFARHESEQTSSWCFGERKRIKLILEGKANDGLTAGAPFTVLREDDGQSPIIHYRAVCLGIGVRQLVSLGRAMAYQINQQCVEYQFGKRVVKYRPSKGLSRMMGNYHVRFLGGEGP